MRLIILGGSIEPQLHFALVHAPKLVKRRIGVLSTIRDFTTFGAEALEIRFALYYLIRMDFKETTVTKLVPLMSELIQNKCVNYGTANSGNEIRSAETLRKFFDTYNIPSETLISAEGRGNILVRIPGTDPRASSLMLMGHLDVVPANSDDWDEDPFGGVVKDGSLWGRGAVDMLNITASAAVAVAELVSREGPAKGDLLFLAVADEEATGEFGARWLVDNHWDKVRADYMVTELGGFFVSGRRRRGITVTIGEKGIAWIRMTVKGIAGHGSMPLNADNAVLKISDLTSAIGSYQPETILSPQYRAMKNGMLDSRVLRLSAGLKATLRGTLRRIYRENAGVAKFLHTASQMTISPDAVQSGNKVNIIADRGILDLDIRLLPGQDAIYAVDSLKGILRKTGIDADIEVREFFRSTVSDADTPLMVATRKIAGEVYPDAHFIPLYIGGATDGRFWRDKGTVVYGFSMFGEEMTMDLYTSMLHGKNERISINSLEKNLEYFYRLPGALHIFDA